MPKKATDDIKRKHFSHISAKKQSDLASLLTEIHDTSEASARPTQRQKAKLKKYDPPSKN